MQIVDCENDSQTLNDLSDMSKSNQRKHQLKKSLSEKKII